MNSEILKSDLDLLLKEVPSSSIQIEKKDPPIPPEKKDINKILSDIWSQKSNELYGEYKYGESLAHYGENDLNFKKFLSRLSSSICSIISNGYQKEGFSTEDLKPIYTIIENSFIILSKKIEEKELKNFNVFSIISSLQGFMLNYIKQKGMK